MAQDAFVARLMLSRATLELSRKPGRASAPYRSKQSAIRRWMPIRPQAGKGLDALRTPTYSFFRAATTERSNAASSPSMLKPPPTSIVCLSNCFVPKSAGCSFVLHRTNS